MAHPAIVKYLRDNKDRFPLERLRQQLAAQGYPPDVIAAGVAEVYGTASGAAPPQPPAAAARFFDFRQPFVYRATGQKVGHFLVGLVVIPLAFFLVSGMIMVFWRPVGRWGSFTGYSPLPFFITTGVSTVLYFALWGYTFRYRRWVFWGMLPSAILNALGAIGIIFSFNYLF